MIRWLLPLLLLASPALAEESIVSGLSQNRVSITADFDGSEILIYGAVKREAPVPKGSPLQVIVTVEGPSTPVIVRRKDRVAGIWINNAEVRVDSAPSFYAVATTGPLSDILSDTENLRHRVTIERAIRAVGITGEADQADAFVQAMLRVRSNEDRYRVLEGAVQLTDDTLFRTDVVLPSNLTEGEYTVRLFLLRDGKVVATQERVIRVRKEGLERFIFTMAHDQPLLYGLLSLVLAGIAGWAASAAFRLIR
ncbi:TIGR02186 family protein [Tabrizicola sp. BL-A-41-H6]|uniref:TIGR02186 family protein n=1 Tax=Tabrizicola sp. BL-A-41-H6 TaxID=3421107 RepID=UPI003D66EB20